MNAKSIALTALVVACGGTPPRAQDSNSSESPPVVEEAPLESASPAASQPSQAPEPSQPTWSSRPSEEPLGIESCDEYLALYQSCEGKLEPLIAAGERRSYRVERESLRYLLSTPERAAMPEACKAMLEALRKDCGA